MITGGGRNDGVDSGNAEFTPSVLGDAKIKAGSVAAWCEVNAEADKASFPEKNKHAYRGYDKRI